jgi:hypothetical protein
VELMDRYSLNRLLFPKILLINTTLSDEELARLYKAADAFVLPTRGEVIWKEKRHDCGVDIESENWPQREGKGDAEWPSWERCLIIGFSRGGDDRRRRRWRWDSQSSQPIGAERLSSSIQRTRTHFLLTQTLHWFIPNMVRFRAIYGQTLPFHRCVLF